MLKDILATHNINFEAELERRKAERPMTGFQTSPVAAGSAGSQTGMASMTAHTYSTPPTTVSSGMSPKANGVEKVDFSSAPDIGSNSQAIAAMPCDALAAIDRRPAAVGGGGGVFEDNPQLQVDFILAYVFLIRFFRLHIVGADFELGWNHRVENIRITFAGGLSLKPKTKTCRSLDTR